MAGSSQPQIFFAAGCLFADFAIAEIFYSVIKTLWKFFCTLFGCCHTQILNFANMLKIVRKWGQSLNLLEFRIIFNIFAKLIFKLKIDIWVWQHPNNVQNNVHEVFITGWKMTAIAKLQFSNFVKIFVVAGEIHSYVS